MNDTDKAKLEELLRDIANLAAEIKGRHATSVIGCKVQDALAIVSR